MKKSKYCGKILDGKWLIDSYELRNHHYYYKLINIYNSQTIEIVHTTLLDIIRGKTSVSKIISFRIAKSGDQKFSYGTKRLSNRFYK